MSRSVETARPPSPARVFMGSPTGVVSLVCVGALVVLAALGPDAFGASATTVDVVGASQNRSSDHPLGTDGLGRDIFWRTLAATRTSLTLAAMSVLVAVVLGAAIGGLVAASSRRTRRIGGAVVDTMMSIGSILLAIVVVAIVGIGAKGVVIAVGVAFAPSFARFTFALVTGVMSREYLAAGRTVGLGRRRIAQRYVGLNVADSLAIAALSMLGDCLIALSSLSFLGLGVQSPSFDWGQMLTDAVKDFYLNPYASLGPALMITFSGVSLALLGDALARAVNPLLWEQGGARRRRGARVGHGIVDEGVELP
ncbi:ABC transporter permease [Janibacter melonis]|uniref:ABC transporter permease n=1 Tax=Janibacter melonis TaxID=262209 RepID=UPI00177C3F08|nr:ABC transporter permease [Janibacter melonis]